MIRRLTLLVTIAYFIAINYSLPVKAACSNEQELKTREAELVKEINSLNNAARNSGYEPSITEANAAQAKIHSEELRAIRQRLSECQAQNNPTPNPTPESNTPTPNNSTNRSDSDCTRANAELEFLRGLLTFLSDENIKARAVQSDLQNTIKRLTEIQKQTLSQYKASNTEFEITQKELDNFRELIGKIEGWVDRGFTVRKLAQASLAIRKFFEVPNPKIKLSASTQALIKKLDALDAENKALDATASILQNEAEDTLDTGNLGWERLITLTRDYYDYVSTGTSQEVADSKLRASEVFTNISQRTGEDLRKYRTILKENQKTINGLSQSIKLVEARLKKSGASCK